MAIQAESLQNAMQAVDYSNPGGRVHMDQMGMMHPEVLQHGGPEYKGTGWWALKFWLGRASSGSTIWATKDDK